MKHLLRHVGVLAILATLLSGCNAPVGVAMQHATDSATQPLGGVLGTVNNTPLPFPEYDRFVSGWQHLHSYTNGDTNHCGQATAAMMLAHAGLNPLNLPTTVLDPIDRKRYPANEAFVSALAAKHSPDVLFGLAGTSPSRLASMLDAYGMRTHFSTADDYATGIQRWIDAGWPVATLVDAGSLWGQGAGLHWIVIYKMDGQQVWAGNTPDGKRAIPLSKFRDAWGCKGYPIHFASVAAELKR